MYVTLQGLPPCYSKLQSTGIAPLITGWVGDQDSSVLKQLRQCLAAQRWEVHLDPGHAKKNLYKALQAMFGEKQAFDGLAALIPGVHHATHQACREGTRWQHHRHARPVSRLTRLCGASLHSDL